MGALLRPDDRCMQVLTTAPSPPHPPQARRPLHAVWGCSSNLSGCCPPPTWCRCVRVAAQPPREKLPRMQVPTTARASPAGCSQVSASQLTTGFVGQTGAKTRDIFESARGAVLFIDEAYRLYDPLGRSYMQEAIDEIVTLLTEETYKGKMVVIFAGYQGQMSEMLDKVKKMADSH